jgi:hypothetical protein
MTSEWESMTIDELFALREQMQAVLIAKLVAKKADLERRLQMLDQLSSNEEPVKPGQTGTDQTTR